MPDTSNLPAVANSPSGQPGKVKAVDRLASAAARLFDFLSSFRKIETVFIFDDPDHNTGNTIVIPVPDDAFKPSLQCGEFALIDISDTEPTAEDGLFAVWISEGRTRRMLIVMLRHFDVDGIKCSHQKCHRHWSLCFGVRPMFSMAGGVTYHLSGDGPLCDRYLREKIVGRVIGVLGDGERTLNWKRAVQS